MSVRTIGVFDEDYKWLRKEASKKSIRENKSIPISKIVQETIEYWKKNNKEAKKQ